MVVMHNDEDFVDVIMLKWLFGNVSAVSPLWRCV